VDTDSSVLLTQLREVSATSPFNRWLGFEVVSAGPGVVEMRLAWRDEFGQYSGFLHAGIVGALLDTACGFAAATLAGANLLASQFSVRCLRPAVAKTFVVRGRVIKPGRQQIFAAAELEALESPNKLLAVCDTLLITVK